MRDGFRSMGQQANLVRRAFGGDRSAARQLIGTALTNYRERLLDIRAELDYHRANTWNEAAARSLAFGDDDQEATAEQTIGALSAIHTKLLLLCSTVPVMLMSDDEEAEPLEDQARAAAMDLFLLLHTPEIRYAIVAGFRPELRADVDEYLDRMGLELWGTIDALLADEQITVEDFPPETASVMAHMADVAEARQE